MSRNIFGEVRMPRIKQLLADGKVVRIPIPSLTEERRKELAKKAHHMAEESRIEIRRFRHEGNDRLKKMFRDKEISEDEQSGSLTIKVEV